MVVQLVGGNPRLLLHRESTAVLTLVIDNEKYIPSWDEFYARWMDLSLFFATPQGAQSRRMIVRDSAQIVAGALDSIADVVQTATEKGSDSQIPNPAMPFMNMYCHVMRLHAQALRSGAESIIEGSRALGYSLYGRR